MKHYEDILLKIQNNEISAEEGYDILFQTKEIKLGMRAHFVKLKIYIKDEGKGVNTLLRVLFALPIPIALIKTALRIAKRHVNLNDIDLDEIGRLLKYSKHQFQ